MKEIDNFKLLVGLLDFPTDDVFYFGQIIGRRKDQIDKENFGPDNRVYRDLYFKSLEEFWDKETEIKKFCRFFHARAYIHLNKRSKKDVAFEALRIMAEHLAKGEYQSLRSVYSTACGQKQSDPNKKWILDIDFDNVENKIEMRAVINALEPKGDKILAVIPTLNGQHYITRPFNSAIFAVKFSHLNDWSLQKNNPTLLYCNI